MTRDEFIARADDIFARMHAAETPVEEQSIAKVPFTEEAARRGAAWGVS